MEKKRKTEKSNNVKSLSVIPIDFEILQNYARLRNFGKKQSMKKLLDEITKKEFLLVCKMVRCISFLLSVRLGNWEWSSLIPTAGN